MSLQEIGKIVIQAHNPFFNESRGWVRTFFNWQKLALSARTSISQKLSKQLEGVFSKFYEDAGRFMWIGKYPLSLVGNIDETSAVFDLFPLKSISKTSEREWVVCSSRSEKKKTCRSCFISYRRWTNGWTNYHFQKKNWTNNLWFKHPLWFYCQNTKEVLDGLLLEKGLDQINLAYTYSSWVYVA